MIDIHVHFFPAKLFQAIWRFFETASGGLWRIHYKVHGQQHIRILREQGVNRFTTLVYAHKPGVADALNEFIKTSAERHPELIPFGTLFAGDGHCESAARRLFEQYRFSGIKLHPFVSGEPLDDRRFFPVYEMMQSLGKVLICHPGSAPVYHQYDGAERLRRVLTQFPNLKVVIAHCGAFEYNDYRVLADEFEQVYFDTAMNGVPIDFLPPACPGREFFLRYQDRILFGSDFPNIPYAYAEQIEALKRMDLGEDIEEKIFFENARRLFGWTKTVT